MGILGSGMSGIASLASQMGYQVSGCDLKLEGHNSEHLKDIDLLVVSPAILYQEKEDPELILGKNKNIVTTWQEFLGKYLMKDKKVIAIAGTHGKSTTTAMVAKILIDNGFDPSVVIGAYVFEWKGNSRYGKDKYFIVEADEFNDNFLNYYPNIAVINNIEFDHPDYFKDEKQVFESFEKFKKNLVGEKILITEKDSLNKRFNLKVFGEHNQKNANMAYLVGRQLKIKKEEIIKSLENFTGIGRRMELIGKVGKTLVFDDYAHHPTAIRATLAGVRQRFSNRIWAIIEAHGFNRTNALLKLYKGVFSNADKVIVGPIYKARDKNTFEMTPEKIAIASGHKDIKACNTIEEIINTLKNEVKQKDIIVVMGAGKALDEISLLREVAVH